jgi:dipeptidyl aminopeptidase/acylaminoacyl peptidase
VSRPDSRSRRTKGRPINWHDWSPDGRYLMFLNDENGDENLHLFAVVPGTREEGRKLLAERSPINKVENIKKPMLIFHGANDVRCKVAESDSIVAAMQTKNIPVTYVVYPDEGHGFAKPPNRLSYIAMTEAFFARHLGGAFEPVGGDLEGSSHEIRTGGDVLT